MKKPIKVLSLLLALLMLGTAMTACKKDNKSDDGSKDSATTVGGDNGSQEGVDANGYVKDTLPDNLDYRGKELNVLHWQERASEDWLEEATPGAIIDEAVVARQKSVEARLNIKFKVNNTVPGNWSARLGFIRTLEAETDAATSGIDLVGQYMPVAPSVAMRGIYGDLSSNAYLNFSKPWWPKNVVDTSSIAGSTYFVTGDATPTTVTMLGQVFINLDMYENMGGNRNDIYQTVKDGKWTMEYLKKMALDKVGIEAGASTKPLEKTYGILFDHSGCYDNLFYGAGFVTIEHDDNGLLVISEDMKSDRLTTWFQTCQDLLFDNPDVALGGALFEEQGETFVSGGTFKRLFATGQALVYMNGVISDIQQTLRTLQIDFAVAPYPKYDEDQESYATVTGNHNTFYGIPHNVGDFDMVCIALEALSSEGYRSLIPTIYEDSFRSRFFETEENAEMLDIIRASLIYEPGRTFCEEIGTFNAFRAAAEENQVWSQVISKEPTWQSKINKINETLGAK
ncbi:MAG: hypothetical protein ACI3XQ_11215 [Eubacteriales bacterium]